ncbi:ABC transporter permease [Saccharibacillus kuerlensis]|uniref:ABC transporter permease n=1 Tax=Saccharibacillus kuerlensis TaxID=459527 RepID=A0ABQ2KUE3_9BACL|nr:ABC transporter permease [Saccharibacillus kuerlensis]GGN91870.1 hypothetical protein GCM10010969_03780 [Saccharibacillus kuerlensis]
MNGLTDSFPTSRSRIPLWLRLIGYELRKSLRGPVVPALCAAFLLLNVFVMLTANAFPLRGEIKMLSGIAEKYGIRTEEPGYTQLQADYRSGMEHLNEIAVEKEGVTYEHAADFWAAQSGKAAGSTASDPTDSTDALPPDPSTVPPSHPSVLSNPTTVLPDSNPQNNGFGVPYTEEELDEFYLTAVMEWYAVTPDTEAFYRNLDVQNYAEFQIGKFGLSGSAADVIREQYAKLDERTEEIVSSGDHGALFFPGPMYKMHSLLFKTMLGFLIFESLLLTVLVTGTIAKYEFEQRTAAVVYATRRGRRTAADKLLASLSASFLLTAGLCAVTLLIFFGIYDYGGLWNAPISSYFNMELDFPYLTWTPLTVRTYLLSALVLIAVVQLIFAALSFVLSGFLKNSYYVFAGFALCYGLFVMLPSIVPRDASFWIYSMFTPFYLILNPHGLFMGAGTLLYEGKEWITLSVWSGMIGFAVLLGLKRFGRQNL